ncbi:MAG: hypothetical protein R3E65_12690, partial [Steroidobacteraceae bacterium]
MSAVWESRSAIVAGIVCFAIVFAIGFVLGTVRTLLLVPRLGPLVAVAIELPIMIGASWHACRYALRRYRVSAAIPQRLLMGGVALLLLLTAELGISVGLGGLSTAQHFALYALPEHRLGLAAQLLFG